LKKRNIIGLVISAILLYLAFRKVDRELLVQSLAKADYLWLIPAFLLMVLSIVFRAVRWKYLLRPITDPSFKHLFSASAIGLMANNLLPARLGEIARAWVIGEKEGISKTSSFATIVVERIFDGFTVIFFLAAILILFEMEIPASYRGIAYAAVISYVAVLGFLFLLRYKRGGAIAAAMAIAKPLPPRVSQKLRRHLDSFVEGLGVLRNPQDILLAGLLSILVWAPTIIVLHSVLKSFDLDLPSHASIMVFVIVTFGIMIPSAPGFVGTVQYCFVVGLGLFGIGRSEALGVSIVYHAAVFIPLTATGLFCLMREGMSFNKLRTAVEEEGSPEVESNGNSDNESNSESDF
jgi:uncharacterized protein (TIRG00374 family)